MNNNIASIVGTVYAAPTFDHSVRGEKFYLFYINSIRKSGFEDSLPVIISERLLNNNIDYCNLRVEIKGSFRSHKLFYDGNQHKRVFLFVDEMYETDKEDYNEILLNGYICSKVTYRETPLGRKLSDACLAVNRHTNKADYIPILLWSRNAMVVADMPVGTHIKIAGRMQSRIYQKKMPDGSYEDREYYEVSAYWMEEVGQMLETEEIS